MVHYKWQRKRQQLFLEQFNDAAYFPLDLQVGCNQTIQAIEQLMIVVRRQQTRQLQIEMYMDMMDLHTDLQVSNEDICVKSSYSNILNMILDE